MLSPVVSLLNGGARPHCNLTQKLRGRVPAPDQSRGRTLSFSARGDTIDSHGPLQRLLDATYGYLRIGVDQYINALISGYYDPVSNRKVVHDGRSPKSKVRQIPRVLNRVDEAACGRYLCQSIPFVDALKGFDQGKANLKIHGLRGRGRNQNEQIAIAVLGPEHRDDIDRAPVRQRRPIWGPWNVVLR